jgi:hypothetical protein
MYTNNPQYLQYTYSGYESGQDGVSGITPSGINSPLLWHTELRNNRTVSFGANTDAAVILKYNGTYYDYNYGKINQTIYNSYDSGWVWSQGQNGQFPPGSDFSTPSNASFDVYIDPAGFYNGSNSVQNDNYAPVAAAISSITVESMNYFPSTVHDIGWNYGPGVHP